MVTFINICAYFRARILNIVDDSRGHEELINSVTVTTAKSNDIANFKRCIED
jgi:hypothetical protein